MGGAAAIAAVVSAAAVKANEMHSERKARSAELKNIRNQKAINEEKKRNILEQQLAKRRARVGSMGISASGSSMAVQRKMVSDSAKDISYDDYNYDTQYSKAYNAYQSNLRSQLIKEGSNLVGYTSKLIK